MASIDPWQVYFKNLFSFSLSLVPSSLGLRNILVGKICLPITIKSITIFQIEIDGITSVCGGWGITKEEMIHSDVSQSLTCQQDEDGQRWAVPFHVVGLAISWQLLDVVVVVVCCVVWLLTPTGCLRGGSSKRNRRVGDWLLYYSSALLCIIAKWRRRRRSFFLSELPLTHTHLCDTRPPNVWKRFCFFLSPKSCFSIFSPPHFCCCPLFRFSRSTPSSQKATVHCALTKQLFGHFYFSCIFHAWVFIAKNKLREIKSRNFKSSLVNYLRENSTTATENLKPVHLFFTSPVKENPVRPVLFH